jgi:hypothetical protein
MLDCEDVHKAAPGRFRKSYIPIKSVRVLAGMPTVRWRVTPGGVWGASGIFWSGVIGGLATDGMRVALRIGWSGVVGGLITGGRKKPGGMGAASLIGRVPIGVLSMHGRVTPVGMRETSDSRLSGVEAESRGDGGGVVKVI